MNLIKIDPREHPLQKGESWWVAPVNSTEAAFVVPDEACTVCIKDFRPMFSAGTVYNIFRSDSEGWVKVLAHDTIYEMPQYIFGRHFDAEVFIRSIYKRTLPDEVFNFKDGQ